jgi:hypothetical protein
VSFSSLVQSELQSGAPVIVRWGIRWKVAWKRFFLNACQIWYFCLATRSRHTAITGFRTNFAAEIWLGNPNIWKEILPMSVAAVKRNVFIVLIDIVYQVASL